MDLYRQILVLVMAPPGFLGVVGIIDDDSDVSAGLIEIGSQSGEKAIEARFPAN